MYLFGPGALGEAGIEDLGPPVQALDFGLAFQKLRHQLPVLAVAVSHSLS